MNVRLSVVEVCFHNFTVFDLAQTDLSVIDYIFYKCKYFLSVTQVIIFLK